MPTYPHICTKCQHEWDDFYSIKADPPTTCPSCSEEGCVKRLIAGGSGRGIMILKGSELREKLVVDANNARQRAKTDEKFRANILGEAKYNEQKAQKEKLTKELTNIGKNASKIKSTDVKS